MERQTVSSSNIAAIGYEEPSETLEIEFLNGSIYQYYGVSENTYDQLMSASSHGAFLNHEIRDNYSYERVG